MIDVMHQQIMTLWAGMPPTLKHEKQVTYRGGLFLSLRSSREDASPDLKLRFSLLSLKPLDSFEPLNSLGPLNALGSLGPLNSLVSLGALNSFESLSAADSA